MIQAITFDFWGTIFQPDPPPGKQERREALLLAALAEAGVGCAADRLQAAFRSALERGNAAIQQSWQEIPPPGWWALLCAELGVPDRALPFERVAYCFEEITLDFPPALLPGVAEAVRALHGRYRLGLICNTGFTGGRVLRQLLDRHGLLGAFDRLTFSDEFGRAKPDPAIFRHTLAGLGVREPGAALHVGDLEETDVAGALAVGCWAARYRPAGPVETRAHRLFHDWAAFPGLVAELDQGLAADAPGGSARAPGASP